MELELALRKLGAHLDEQQKAEKSYKKLREEYRKGRQNPPEMPANKKAD